jgi:hypothetical protein
LTGKRTEPAISPPDAGLIVGPRPECLLQLRDGQRGAHHVGRLGDDDRGRRVHHHHELLGLCRHVGGGDRIGCQDEATEDVDAVAHHQLLRQPLGHVGGDAAGVLADELKLLAGNGVALLLDVELDGIVHLRGGIGELPRIGHDEADLDGVLRACRCGKGNDGGGQRAEQSKHWRPPLVGLCERPSSPHDGGFAVDGSVGTCERQFAAF